MRATGIVRKLDSLGRIVIPIELRRSLELEEKDAAEIFVDDDRIVLKKYEPNNKCMVTGDVRDDNAAFANGHIMLSPEGAQELLEHLKDYLSR